MVQLQMTIQVITYSLAHTSYSASYPSCFFKVRWLYNLFQFHHQHVMRPELVGHSHTFPIFTLSSRTINVAIVGNDEMNIQSAMLNQRIATRCRRGVNASAAFITEFWSTALFVGFVYVVLLVGGTICYRYFADQKLWGRGAFYSIASATTIGYGNIDVDNDTGYFAIGVYNIACSYCMQMTFPKVWYGMV